MNPFEDFEVISVYTRKQAIEDGVLIDITHLAKQAHFTLHTVISATLFSTYNTDEAIVALLSRFHSKILEGNNKNVD